MEKKQKIVTQENRDAVEKIAKQHLVRDIIARITKDGTVAHDPTSLCDLEQDILLSLLYDEKVPKLLEENRINFYITRIVLNNIISSSSNYYRTYLRTQLNKIDIEDLKYHDRPEN